MDSFRGVTIAKKGEELDFLAIVLSGRILTVDQEIAVSALTMGDIIGYMNWTNLPGFDRFHSEHLRTDLTLEAKKKAIWPSLKCRM